MFSGQWMHINFVTIQVAWFIVQGSRLKTAFLVSLY